jgi:probable F420-dependent oxidoreductase
MRMKFTVQYPIAEAGYDPELLSREGLARFARTAEDAGFHAIAFTDHPAPSHKWLQAGGHDSLDPLTALGFCAAVTDRIRLMSYALVAPYRNPLLAAKQGATVDRLSDGRLTLVLGAGYLRSEFAALGVDFSNRNALMDEAIEVLKGIWQNENFHYEGKHFTAIGQTARPFPVQQPHPPLWFGGNSDQSLRRVAADGRGWSPLIIREELSSSVRTRALDGPHALANRLCYLSDLLQERGRSLQDIDVQIDYAAGTSPELPKEVVLDSLAEFSAAGATWAVITPRGRQLENCLEELASFGEKVISQLPDDGR